MKYLKVSRSNTAPKKKKRKEKGKTEDRGSHLKTLPTASTGRTGVAQDPR